MKFNTYLDLDGVFANFDAYFMNTYGMSPRDVADEIMWDMIHANESYFANIPPFDGAKEFFDKFDLVNPIILTSCPHRNYRRIAAQKRAWIQSNLSDDVMICPMIGGKNKPFFMKKPGDILIDDWSKNIDAWNEAGGVGILHKGNYEETYSQYMKIFVDRI